MNTDSGFVQFEDHDTNKQLMALLTQRNEIWKIQMPEVAEINGSLRTIVLSCIDSRVQVENIFQAKPGELLVIKNAGNLPKFNIRSILVGVLELNVKNVIIMGHKHCGMAIRDNTAKINHIKGILGEEHLKNLRDFAKMDPMEWFGFYDNGKWDSNVFNQVKYLKDMLTKFLPENIMPNVIGALYDIHTGQVEFMETKDIDIMKL
jgi:carbonic anhydrase